VGRSAQRVPDATADSTTLVRVSLEPLHGMAMMGRCADYMAGTLVVIGIALGRNQKTYNESTHHKEIGG
jgi:hypothetical protein